jgi:cytochrome P450
MGIDVKETSLWDTFRLQFFVTLLSFLWGLVAPNRFFVWCLSRWDAGRATIRFLGDLRRKYECDHLWVWFPLGKTLLVMDPDSVDAVLRSEENAADPTLKKRALSGFVPDALVISSGDEWKDRRPFNENVLGFGKLHPHHDAFKEIVFREVDRLTAERVGALRWADFQRLGERISHQVILGSGQVEPEMTVQLARLVRRSNLVVLPRNRRAFSVFYDRLERHLREQPVPPSCLMHESAKALADGSATSITQVPRQIGFWFFVLKDAIELHVARTLALIAAHQDVQTRLRREIREAPKSTAQAIDDFAYLDACIGEQLRLWTPVPILLRRAVKPFSLRGIMIQPEQQILIHTGSYHRDSRFFGEAADKFSPDAGSGAFPRVYFFSDYRQSCAGQFLVSFLLKAALVSLLARFRFELIAPGITPGPIPCLYDHFRIELRTHGDG